MTRLREPRAYRFARQLGRAASNPDLLAVLGAGWVTAGVWVIHHAAGMIALGVFILLFAAILSISHLRSGR